MTPLYISEILYFNNYYSKNKMEDQSASRLVPTALVESTIHEEFPVIDKKSYIDRSIDKIVPAVIFPESTDLEGVTSLEFVIHQSSEHYIDLSSIEIELKLTLLDGDGIRDGIQAATNVYFINDLLQAFFPTRKIYINNTALESCYHGSHVSRLKHLLNTQIPIFSCGDLTLSVVSISLTTR